MAPADDWFNSYARPDKVSVAEYAAAPPRGMTNPPGSEKVRQKLLKDLAEYGVALEAPSWPPPKPAEKDALQEHPLVQRLRRSQQVAWRPSGRNITAGLVGPVKPSQESRPRSAGGRQSRPASAPHPRARQQPEHSNTAATSSRRPQSAAAAQSFQRPKSAVGRPTSAAATRRSREMVAWTTADDVTAQSQGHATQRWRSEQWPVEERDRSFPTATGSSRDRSPQQRSPKSNESDDDVTFLPGGKAAEPPIDDTWLRNTREAMKSESALHTALIGDTFRQPAAQRSSSALAIGKGAVTASGVCTNAWACEAAALLKFHNQAIRNIAPSGLDKIDQSPITIDVRKRKLRKTGKNEYAADQSTVKLRQSIHKLKKSLHLDDEEDDDGLVHAEIRANMTAMFQGLYFGQ